MKIYRERLLREGEERESERERDLEAAAVERERAGNGAAIVAVEMRMVGRSCAVNGPDRVSHSTLES